ncbi:MarR family winged helix-turn-helix transcriptional regulator [Luteimicrobium subarcticum]|uniref:MarR family transcriptional regulator n=1 Tax=Luteimicrobium subarcticum TaxID=620910 RepID=A0A2M8W3G7_9MICO|nr:MarR family transcriptional regulator [Luteimicrobium subarcticum]PJI85450.1 MarR family transcriptional regulator [Luteimicrobium subarcticum]
MSQPPVDGPAEPPGAGAGEPPSGADFLGVLHAALRAVRRETQDRLGADVVAPGQVRLLRVLARSGGELRPSSIADALDVSPRSVTSKVDAAERDGLVVRRPDRSDRRATLVGLTDVGRAALDRFGALRASGADGLLHRLAPHEQRTLVALLARVADTGTDGTGSGGARSAACRTDGPHPG